MMRRSLSRSALLLLGVALASCDVQPYCFDCVDSPLDAGRLDAGDTGARDASDTGPHDSNVPDTAIVDAWVMPDGCAIGATELCNHFDDDCDTLIDEGVDTTHDVDNCGSCGHRCTYAHAFGDCTASTCSMGTCSAGYVNADGMDSNGCEYHCISTGTETCDRRDNDCDGMIDEGFVFDTDPMNCGICGRVCNLAHSTSSCGGGMCSIGACAPGFVDRDMVAANGCEYACTATGAETCNRIDDDCDGMIDEGDPGSGGSCGSSVGICHPGVQHCVSGALTCMGGVSPGVESCNNLDDDCDGTIDDGNPGGGPACGSAIGACTPGRMTCTAGGHLTCVGATAPATEVCNGVDDDCNGAVDNGNPGGGATCGVMQGRCHAGATMCSGGTLSCAGATGPVLETCNMIDDDCNGVVDDGFDRLHDPRNCGTCGNVCSFPHAVAQCVPNAAGTMGMCQIAACVGGFVNLDGSLTNTNGCEYACNRTSSIESCNGLDDNCNGTIDEGVAPPANFCRSQGVCLGTMATCAGASGFLCNYPAADASGRHGYQAVETICDGSDNDCDGGVDEPFPTLNNSCNNGGVGQCLHTGTIQCSTTAPYTSVTCNAAAGAVMTESCNGIDDDCDGTIDDGITARGTWTRIRPVGGAASGTNDYWIQTYEASRPDASATAVGLSAARACSMPNRLPWTSITAPNAATACAAVGGVLCTETQWQRACESAAATACNWSSSTACNTYNPNTCNGVDFDSNTSLPGNQDSLIATGAPGSACYTPWNFTYMTGASTVTAAGNVFDMSGNAEEWTGPRSGTTYPERGGSYNDIAGGMTCQFNFEVADNTVALPNVGFRCCRTTDPALP